MSSNKTIEIKVPDIGDFDAVPVIEILVGKGDQVEVEQPLITLESDKATMDIPSPQAGIIEDIMVSLGDEVSEGSVIAMLSATSEDSIKAEKPTSQKKDSEPARKTDTASAVKPPADSDQHASIVVIGSGPGGYTAAFRAADLGLDVVLIERYSSLGGVCLNVGCIPSKALLHAAKVIEESHEAGQFGVTFSEPEVNIDDLRNWKNGIVSKLTGGLASLAKQRKVKVIQGTAKFTSTHSLEIAQPDSKLILSFDQAIIATGSEAVAIPGFPQDDERLIDSSGALSLTDIPAKLLVIGGGIIGLEMATVYHALGSKVSVVEMANSLIPGADRDLIRPLQKRISKRYEAIWLNTRVSEIKAQKNGLSVSFDGKDAPSSEIFDKVLVAVGRRPNGLQIDADKAGVKVSESGFIEVDDQQRTNVSHIFAIGDIVGQPMLAHKAVHEGKVAAEVAAGKKSGFDARVIPSVAYTDPEIAWVGVTESEAKQQKLNYGKGVFPWAASGRALSLDRSEGLTRLLFDKDSNRLIGAGIVGVNAGDLIAEAALAIEMNADAEDIGLTIHPHPTLSETIGFSAEAFEGTITDLYMPKKKK